ncbi:MAG: hypothetical protein FWG52_03340 [Proteobacteria bacterium]|jgi:type I restriction enzyme R subunit|nr:hypothetical protein [Pseudomonadota bacterium]
MPNHTERTFETAIEHGLIASGGYAKGDPKGFDAATALLSDEAIAFIRASQKAKRAKIPVGW